MTPFPIVQVYVYGPTPPLPAVAVNVVDWFGQRLMIPATAAGVVLAIPLVIVGQGVEHEILAVQPVDVILPSEVNTKVKHPEAFVGVADTVPGPTTPV